MNLVVDIGNTSTKIGVFKKDKLITAGHYELVDINLVNGILNDHQINKAIISTVTDNSKADWELFLDKKVSLSYFDTSLSGNIINHYLTPGTLGLDRLAAVIGANFIFPGENSLVIDGGTCITYDWVDAGGNYFGGSISPGLNMRYKALNYYTFGLPLIHPDNNFMNSYGDSTVTAIQSGVQNGIKHELMGFIEHYKNQHNELNIVLCGGDSIFFDTLLKNSIFAPYIKIEPHLVLKGLNAAIPHNND